MEEILFLTLEHLQLSLTGVLLALVIGLPLGILLVHYRFLAEPILTITDLLQTVPALAMLALLMIVFGLGNTTLVVALVLYSLLPIVRNTYIGIKGVDPGLIEAGKGMGMTGTQLLRQVQLPIALPVILAGIRVALVTAIGIATIGILIGAGGLGKLIWRGIQTIDNQMVLAGAIPAALLAIIIEITISLFERKVIPPGIKKSRV